MLSSQTPNKPSPSHRRQNSTPTSSTTIVKGPYYPAQFNPQHNNHRRGLSLDFAMQPHGNGLTPKQEYRTVSTNPGPISQQDMRAAQMPASSRPGPDEYQLFEDQNHGLDREWAEFDRKTLDPDMAIFSPTSPQVSNMGRSVLPSQVNASFLELSDPFTIPDQHPEAVRVPNTPQRQHMSNFYPMTPITETRSNVHRLPVSIQPSPSRRMANTTMKPVQTIAMKRGSSCQDSFAMTRQLSDGPPMPSPPGTAPLRSSATFDMAPIPNPAALDIAHLNMDFLTHGEYSSSNYSPTTYAGSPSMSSFQSSPDLPPVNLFGEFTEVPQFSALGQQSDVPMSNDATSPKRRAGSPKKTGSSKAGSDTESAFNPMDYMHNDTGITEEEINAHIQGPDVDGKYYCLHEECVNRQSSTRKENVFGRKENIRAHVQTHLEDRRFECDVCYKRFVRPNDLKRHWNIHLNKRDFKCVCKAAFNRHDALKRHRERSEYCESGGKRGVPGSPKKEEKKRGRPRKIAPTETEERRERKALIRRQVLKKKQASAASSVASSHPSPPPDFDVPEPSRYHPAVNGYSPVLGSFTPPASPGHSVDDIFSPIENEAICTPKRQSASPPPTRGSMISLGSNSGAEDNDFSMDFLRDPLLPTTVQSPPKSVASNYGTPPELDLSSSSPSVTLMDFSFADSLNQSSQSSNDTGYLDDMIGKAANESFDKIFQFMNSENVQESANNTDDMDIFRDTLQDDLYWAHS